MESEAASQQGVFSQGSLNHDDFHDRPLYLPAAHHPPSATSPEPIDGLGHLLSMRDSHFIRQLSSKLEDVQHAEEENRRNGRGREAIMKWKSEDESFLDAWNSPAGCLTDSSSPPPEMSPTSFSSKSTAATDLEHSSPRLTKSPSHSEPRDLQICQCSRPNANSWIVDISSGHLAHEHAVKDLADLSPLISEAERYEEESALFSKSNRNTIHSPMAAPLTRFRTISLKRTFTESEQANVRQQTNGPTLPKKRRTIKAIQTQDSATHIPSTSTPAAPNPQPTVLNAQPLRSNASEHTGHRSTAAKHAPPTTRSKRKVEDSTHEIHRDPGGINPATNRGRSTGRKQKTNLTASKKIRSVPVPRASTTSHLRKSLRLQHVEPECEMLPP